MTTPDPLSLARRALAEELSSEARDAAHQAYRPAQAYLSDLLGRAASALIASQEEAEKLRTGIPSYEGILEMLPSVLASGTETCPLCGRLGSHDHSPEEIVIYRNGVKCGRAIGGHP